LQGIAIIPGKVWHNENKKNLYFIFIDADTQKAIDELRTRSDRITSLQEMSRKFLVEQHKDSTQKAHIYFYSPILFPKKNADSVLGLEVKGLGEHGIAFCFPSTHKDGMPYEIIGTNQPVTLTLEQARELMQHLNQICIKYGLQYLERDTSSSNISSKMRNIIKNLVIDTTLKIPQGQRHVTLISAADSLLCRHLGKGKNKSGKWLRDFFENINYQLCESEPLPESEIDSIWNSALEFVTSIRDKESENKDDYNDSKSASHSKSYAETLLQLATENIQLLFKDQYGTAYALIHTLDHNEILKVESDKFKRYLSKLFYDNNESNKIVNVEAINNVIQILQAKAEYEGQTIPLSLRVAWYGDGDNGNDGNGYAKNIYYDMTDDKGRFVKISKEEQDWQIINKTPTPLFVRYNQTAQVQPDRNYESDVFDRFLQLTNVKDEQSKILLKVYIVSLFIPDIPHAILVLHGEKGSAKSTLQQLIKLLVDPAKPILLTIHKDRSEFIQQLNHNYIAFYDNVKQIPYWLSDEACKAVTGIGQTKRKLYSDDDDIVYEYKRCLGFNGINISLTEPDPLDRSILIELTRISKENRRVESEIIAEFLKLRPKLLGYIFDILVKALQVKPTITLQDLPRMADFAVWGEAISRAMGNNPLEFINAYYENIGRQNIEAVEAHPLGQAIAKYFEIQMDNDDEFKALEGSPMEILETLEVFAEQCKIDIHHKLWPKSPNVLSRRLNQIRSNLLEGLGIEVIISRVTTSRNGEGKANTSYLKIRKIPPVSPIPPAEKNHEGNYRKTAGDILGTGDIISPADQIPPVKSHQNHAQKSAIGDTGGTGDILLNPMGGYTKLAENNINTTTIVRQQQQQQQQQFRFECYYCDIFKTDTKKDYESHVVLKHPRKPCYPSRAYLDRFGLDAKGKDWEI
jgi:hypothetical protein